jgi:hypothetical protein
VELELYDLDNDPGEFTNLAGIQNHSAVLDRLLKILLDQWGDPDALTAKIVRDQEDRKIVRDVTGVGTIF